MGNSVNHPKHYNGKFECIDVMQDVFGVDELKTFCKVNAFKYLYRCNNKNGDEDIQKANWYLNKYIELCCNSGGTIKLSEKQLLFEDQKILRDDLHMEQVEQF